MPQMRPYMDSPQRREAQDLPSVSLGMVGQAKEEAMSEPVFRYDHECGCSLSIYANAGEMIADFSILGDAAPGIAWAQCSLHQAAHDLLAAVEETLKELISEVAESCNNRCIHATDEPHCEPTTLGQARAAIKKALPA